MTALRRCLQCLILACSACLLVSGLRQPEPAFYGLPGLLCLTALLLHLTRALRSGPSGEGGAESRPGLALGGLLMLLGICCVLNGASQLLELQLLPVDGEHCRALCSLTRILREHFGETAGKLAALLLWTGSGVFLCRVGQRALREH